MTAPRQEPSTKRDITGLGWGERQLARRPAPSSATIFDWARQERVSTTDITVSGNTLVVMNTFNRTSTSVFASTGNGIEVLLDGLYSIAAQTQWSVYNATARHMYVVDDAYGLTAPGILAESVWNTNLDDWLSVGETRILPAHTAMRLWVVAEDTASLYGAAAGYPDGNWLEVHYHGPVADAL